MSDLICDVINCCFKLRYG